MRPVWRGQVEAAAPERVDAMQPSGDTIIG
jgi:hypothetical protein